MSKIYRTQDLQRARVNEINLHERTMGPQQPSRPAGGFAGLAGGGETGEALSHLERREREAARIIEAARREAEALQADAYREGFAQGERAGEKLALQKAEPVVQKLLELIEALRHEQERLAREHERELIKVAFSIAAAVIKHTIETRPEMLCDVIDAALAKVVRAREVVVRLAPADCQMLETLMRRKGEAGWPPPHVRVEPDETVGRGGCRVETETGDVDATIEMQLRVLKQALWSD